MTQPALTLLYDGSCPLCSWEKRRLMRRDKHGLLGFIDIQSPAFDASVYGVSTQALMGRLHGITHDGRMLVGVEVLIASYRAVGWWWAYIPLSMVPRRLTDRAYGWFAEHRYVLSRRFGRWFGVVCEKESCRR
jgi:predicted DCC family thiol-disulfide oxidoreductase YuxK